MTRTDHIRILIIDDDDVDRERMRRCLKGSRLLSLMLEAESGKDALNILCKESVDCVLLDNCLGDTTGAILLKAIRDLTPYRGPIIMVTGAGSDALFNETMHEGASDYVPKHQLDVERLTQAVLRSLKSHESLAAEQAASQQLSRHLAEQERRLSQLDRTLQDILDQAPNVIGYWDKFERVRFGNVLHQVWFDVSPHDLVDMKVEQLLGPELYAIHSPYIQRALQGQPQRFEHSMPMVGSNDTRIVRVDYLPDLKASQDTQGFYVTLSDLTELVRARDAAQESARLKHSFLANMSHEIRTPMNAILGLLRLTLDKSLTPDIHSDIHRAHDASLALMAILDDILDHSQLEAGKLRFDPHPIATDVLIRRSLDLFSGRIAQKKLDLIVEMPPDFPLAINVDALRVAQVLNNLLGNAVKFTEQGSIILRCMVSHATGRLRFEVIDTGPGIAMDRQAALFSPFTQEDVSITRRHGGSGLGLSICHSLIQLMSGDIGLISQPAVGSTFWFELPYEPCNLPDSHTDSLDGQAVMYWSNRPVIPGLWQRHPALRTCDWSLASDVDQVTARLEASSRRTCLLIDLTLPPAEVAANMRSLLSRLLTLRGPQPAILLLLSHNTSTSEISGLALPEGTTTLNHPVMGDALLPKLLELLESQKADSVAPETNSPWSAGKRLKGRRVLLVEDNPMNQMVAQAFLNQMDMVVFTVGDGQQAVDRIQQSQPSDFDVILLDLHMPVMDGLTAAQHIRAMPGWESCPIIAMTAAVLADDQTRCAQSGMVDMIAKPIIAEHLVATLLKWIPEQA